MLFTIKQSTQFKELCFLGSSENVHLAKCIEVFKIPKRMIDYCFLTSNFSTFYHNDFLYLMCCISRILVDHCKLNNGTVIHVKRLVDSHKKILSVLQEAC